MTAASIAATPGARRRAAPWFIAEGLLIVILGLLAAFLPGAAGVAGALVFGWLLILSGLFGIVSLFGARHHAHPLWAGLSAAIAIVVGGMILWAPLLGAITLALLVGAYLLADGLTLIMLAFDQRKRAGARWGWLLLAGVVDLLLAVLVLAMGVRADVLLIGYIIALDLVVAGFALVGLGLAARKA
jgi:uncharacterized membrane protein HdeD (DUF308 family)